MAKGVSHSDDAEQIGSHLKDPTTNYHAFDLYCGLFESTLWVLIVDELETLGLKNE